MLCCFPLRGGRRRSPDKVDKAFDAGNEDGASSQAFAKKRTLDGKYIQVDVGQAARHRACLRRGRFGVAQAAWRPRPVFRVGAKKWLCNTDTQLRVATMTGGWKRFVEVQAVFGHWSEWPHAAVALELGSDGLCAVHALAYRWGGEHHDVSRPQPPVSEGADRGIEGGQHLSPLVAANGFMEPCPWAGPGRLALHAVAARHGGALPQRRFVLVGALLLPPSSQASWPSSSASATLGAASRRSRRKSGRPLSRGRRLRHLAVA